MARPILFVDHADALGGAERSLLLLMTFLDRDSWQPHLIAPSGPLAEEAAAAGIPVHTLGPAADCAAPSAAHWTGGRLLQA